MPIAIRAAAIVATTAPTARTQLRRGRAAASARARSASTRHTEPSGCSMRSQATVTTTSAGTPTATVRAALRMRRLTRARSVQRDGDVLVPTDDRDRDAGGLESQEVGIRAA